MNTQKYSISVVTIAMEEKHALIYGKCLKTLPSAHEWVQEYKLGWTSGKHATVYIMRLKNVYTI